MKTDESTTHSTPCSKATLVKDDNRDPVGTSFSYVGMLLYLSGHSLPDIAYEVSQVSQFLFFIKHSHEQVLKLVRRSLLKTYDKGLVLDFQKILTSTH